MKTKLAYTLTKSGSQTCTVNKNTGKQIACYKNRAGAITALKALYAKAGDTVGGDKKSSTASLDDLAFDQGVECFEGDCSRSFLSLSSLISHLDIVHPEPVREVAFRILPDSTLGCLDCSRSFRSKEALADHAESVHTFEDIQRLVAEAVREAYAKPNVNGNGSTWVWVDSMASDWVVFVIEAPNDMNYYKASYVISGTDVTLGEPVQVVRRTVYEPVDNPDPLPEKNQAALTNGL